MQASNSPLSTIDDSIEIEPSNNLAPGSDPAIMKITAFLSENKDIFIHKDLKNLQNSNPELASAILQFQKLQDPLLRLKERKLDSVELVKKEVENIYENFPGWKIGIQLHEALEQINNLLKSFKAAIEGGNAPDLEPKDNPKAKPLYDSIMELKKHGDILLKQDKALDKAYGQATTLFADDLLLTAENFFSYDKKVNDAAEQKKFQDRFNKLINSKKALISEHPNYAPIFKQHVKNILKALLITLSVIGIPLYFAITNENPFKLFCQPKTEGRKLLDRVEVVRKGM